MPGDETVHVAVKRRNPAAVAGDGDGADETGGAYPASGARAARPLLVVRPGEELEPVGAFLATKKSRGKIWVCHVRAAQGLENVE